MNTDPDHLVRFSRSASLDLPEWVTRLIHVQFQDSGPTEFDVGTLEQHTIPEQTQPWLSGEVIHQRHLDHNLIEGDLGFRELHAVQTKGPAFLRSHFGEDTPVVGWKSAATDASGQIYVPFICLRKVILESGSTHGLILDWCWIGNVHFFPKSVALRFPKV